MHPSKASYKNNIMKYYIIAGEASGDLHGSKLMRALKSKDANADFRFYGGDKMQSEGGVLVRHFRDTAVMGFINVLLNLRKILSNIEFCKKDLKEYAPDVLILIDYPGFNLKIAKYAKEELGLRVVYYIPPKIWAWKEHRIKQIKAYVDEVYAIFPFEVDFYARHGYKATYVGNPCVESIVGRTITLKEEFLKKNGLEDKPIIALLAGSRAQEVKSSLKVYKELLTDKFKDYQFVLAATSAVRPELYADAGELKLVFDQTYDLLTHASAAVVNSGTATLETALIGTPQVVCYHVAFGRLAYAIFSRVLKISHVSLVNIIAQRGVVRELLAHFFTAENTAAELEKLLFSADYRSQILSGYAEISQTLGTSIAAEKTAELIVGRE